MPSGVKSCLMLIEVVAAIRARPAEKTAMEKTLWGLQRESFNFGQKRSQQLGYQVKEERLGNHNELQTSAEGVMSGQYMRLHGTKKEAKNK